MVERYAISGERGTSRSFGMARASSTQSGDCMKSPLSFFRVIYKTPTARLPIKAIRNRSRHGRSTRRLSWIDSGDACSTTSRYGYREDTSPAGLPIVFAQRGDDIFFKYKCVRHLAGFEIPGRLPKWNDLRERFPPFCDDNFFPVSGDSIQHLQRMRLKMADPHRFHRSILPFRTVSL